MGGSNNIAGSVVGVMSGVKVGSERGHDDVL